MIHHQRTIGRRFPSAVIIAALTLTLAPSAARAQRGSFTPTAIDSEASSSRVTPTRTPPDVAPTDDGSSSFRPTTPDYRGLDFHGTAPTELRICPENYCSYVSPRIADVLSLDATDVGPRELEWSCPDSGATEALWQVATRPFTDDFEAHPTGLIASGRSDGREEGAFRIDFDALGALLGDAGELTTSAASLFTHEETTTGSVMPMHTSTGSMSTLDSYSAFDLFTEGVRSYFIRAIPFDGTFRAGSPSNTIQVVVTDDGFAGYDEDFLHIPDQPESAYEVRIVDFQPIRTPTVSQGCVYITDVDEDLMRRYYVWGAEQLIDRYTYYMDHDTLVCPRRDDDDGDFLSDLADFIVTVASLPSAAYEEIKARLAETLALLWNETFGSLTGLECDESCQDLLVTGMEIGLAALGIPPELPNAQELIDGGLDYLVAEAVDMSGIECDATCQDLVGEAISFMAEEFANQTAHSLNGQLPMGVRAVPAPESMLRPAELTLEIWRNPWSPVTVEEDDPHLTVSFWATNDAYVGETISRPIGRSTSGTDFGDWNYECEAPFAGALFRSIHLPAPELARGEGIIMPFVLEPGVYWLPGHLDAIQDHGYELPLWDDWSFLYMESELEIDAAIQCNAPTDFSGVSSWTDCGNSVSRHESMPSYAW